MDRLVVARLVRPLCSLQVPTLSKCSVLTADHVQTVTSQLAECLYVGVRHRVRVRVRVRDRMLGCGELGRNPSAGGGWTLSEKS